MTGLVIYFATSFGLAGLARRSFVRLPSCFGLLLVVGASLIPVLVFLLHIVVGLGLSVTAYVIAGLAAVGLVLALPRRLDLANPTLHLHHPVFVLPLGVAVLIVAHGGIAYIPYSGDEFSYWISTAKRLVAVGAFLPEQMKMAYPDYTPGWPLMVAYPSLFFDRFEERLAALSPLVFQVGLLGMVYDVVGGALDRHWELPRRRRDLYAWAVVLLALGAEATGKLVAGNLLVESPQVYGYTALILGAVSVVEAEGNRRPALLGLGLILGAQYLIKVAAFAAMPGMLVLALAAAWLDTGDKARAGRRPAALLSDAAFLRNAAGHLLAAVLPVVILLALWRLQVSGETSTGSPHRILDGALIERVRSDGWSTAAWLFGDVWSYFTSYKLPVSLAAAVGLGLAVAAPRRRWAVGVLVLFIASYFLALYVFHLTVWTEFSRSVPRYTRIPLWIAHLVGLTLLVVETSRLAAGKAGRALATALASPPAGYALVMAVVTLAAWQGHQTYRRIEDLSARSYQPVAAAFKRIPGEAQRIKELIAKGEIPEAPFIITVNQGRNPPVGRIVAYSLVPAARGAGVPDVRFHPREDWREGAQNSASIPVDTAMRAALAQANLVWPIALDAGIKSLLQAWITDSECRADPLAHFLVPERKSEPSLRCIPK